MRRKASATQTPSISVIFKILPKKVPYLRFLGNKNLLLFSGEGGEEEREKEKETIEKYEIQYFNFNVTTDLLDRDRDSIIKHNSM